MKRDPFEKEIIQRREEMDQLDTPPDLWQNITKEAFHLSKHRTLIRYWQIAASLLFVTCIGLGYLLIQKNDEPMQLGDISPAYMQMEIEYIQEIEQIYASLPIDSISHADFSWLLDELSYLDTIRSEYLKDLPTAHDREKVIRALVDYYEKKLKILRKLELEINRQHEKSIIIS